ncbi:hypothetical protein ACHAXS_003198 [Conticribra weissflogii]
MIPRSLQTTLPLAAFLLAFIGSSLAYVPRLPSFSTASRQSKSYILMATATRSKDKTGGKITPGGTKGGDMEWYIDDTSISRNGDDPFHILLLEETYHQNDRITIEYVATSCAYVLTMPYDEAAEFAAHAQTEGFSCLGTWSRTQCLNYGKELQQRDLIVRVVPYCEGSQKPWQARDASESGWAGSFKAADNDDDDYDYA